MLSLRTQKLLPLAIVLSALLSGLSACAPLPAQSAASGKTSEIDKIRGILNDGKSIVFVPNTESAYNWGRMEAQDKSFAIGRWTFYENLNRTSHEIEMANMTAAGQRMARSARADKIDKDLIGTKIAKWPNPHRLEATGADFAFVATRPGATLFIQKIGPLEVSQEGVGNKKLASQATIGTLEFEPTLPRLEYGNERVFKGEAWQTRNETTGHMCNVYGCTPIQQQVSRKTREAGYYDVPITTWGKQGLGAKALLEPAQSPIYLQVPEAGQIYVTDALLFRIGDSFAWGEKNCVQKPVDKAHVYDYRECPLMGVSYVKYDASTTILNQLKAELTAGGWPQELMQRIKYLPLSKFKLSPAEYKAAINAPIPEQAAPARAIAK